MWSSLGLRTRVLVPTIAVLLAGASALVLLTLQAGRSYLEESAERHAVTTIGQLRALRQYYTSKVIAKVVGASELRASADHQNDAGAVPLPATMIHDLSQILDTDGASQTFRMYSEFPFPNRANRQLDEFAAEALRYLEANPYSTFIRTAPADDGVVVRVAVADTMNAQECIDCHNSHPDSPRAGWKLGDVRGVLEVGHVVPYSSALTGRLAKTVAIVSVAILGLAGLLVSLTVGKAVAEPLQDLGMGLSAKAAETDETAHFVKEAGRRFSTSALEQSSLIERSMERIEAVQDRAVQASAEAETALDLMGRTEEMARVSNESLDQLGAVVNDFHDESERVAGITATIDEIAAKTNVLALNASVEAARAGEAGRGFAVVADEVARLSAGAADAARTAGDLIAGARQRAVDGLSKAELASDSVRNLAEGVSRAHQLVDELSRSSREQATGTAQVARSVRSLETAVQQTISFSRESLETGEQLADRSKGLNEDAQRLTDLVFGRRAVSPIDYKETAAAGEAAQPTPTR